MYPNTRLFIGGSRADAEDGGHLPVIDPSTGQSVGNVAKAGVADLDRALEAAETGFSIWRGTPAFERYGIMRRAAGLLRERAEDIARIMTIEQGKPLAQARAEAAGGADTIDWFAEEARRIYGRSIAPRSLAVSQRVEKEPIGPVAAFTPWNFPINQAVRKLSAALAAGCSVVIKGPEETPASCAALVQALHEAGVPPGVINLVFGDPAEISDYLIPHPVIRKVSFTGSTAVGKQLAALAGRHMKRITMELGGHAPAIVFDDADLAQAVQTLVASKIRNAGQVCVSPTRFLVHESIGDAFTSRFVEAARAVKVGSGLEDGVEMGPLAHARRVDAVEGFVADALDKGATLACGGARIGNEGYFFEPTVLRDVPLDARAMNEEPFGPVALVNTFDTYENAMKEANRLPYGLAAYAFTSSTRRGEDLAADIRSGMVSINHVGLGLPETPFGGINDSGYGSEGGTEAIESYLNTKFVTHLH